MSYSPNETRFVEGNAAYAATFDKGHLPLPPSKQYLVLICMESRIDPIQAFGMELGDAHIVRNAGGSAIDALRSIIVSEQMLGTNEIMVCKHTDCGATKFDNDEIRTVIAKRLGSEAGQLANEMDFLPIVDPVAAAKSDVAFLRGCPLIPASVRITGWLYSVETGKVEKVVD